MRRVAYAFNSEAQLDASLKAGRLASLIDFTKGFNLAGSAPVIYAKVTAVRAGSGNKRASATQVQFDDTTNDWATLTNPLIFDSDNVTDDSTTTDLISPFILKVNDIVEVVPYLDNSETQQWIARTTNSQNPRAYVKITAVTDADDYTGSVLTSPFDATVLETGVPIKALNATTGTLAVDDTFYADVVDNAGTLTYVITPPILS